MTAQVAPTTSDDDAAVLMDEAHEQLAQLEARLGALWSTHLAVDPTVADQIAVATRYIRKAAAALADQRLA
jgi:hypothetical protein